MATTLAPNFSLQPRSSAETDRRFLLADSVAPSSAASIVSDFTEGDGDRTPRARSPTRSVQNDEERHTSHFKIPAGQNHDQRDTIADPTPIPQPYRGFPSEAHYLAALNAWADSKKFTEPGDTSLLGFYGHTSMQEYADKPAQDFGIKRKWRARREAKQQKQEAKIASQRRNTVT